MSETNTVRWEFYDRWTAFPWARHEQHHPSMVGELCISYDVLDPDGDHVSNGEWAIEFYDFDRNNRFSDRPERVSAKLTCYGESWSMLASSGLLEALTTMDARHQPMDAVAAVLTSLGMFDKTANLRGNHPAYCSTCHGKGVLDDVAPSDRAAEQAGAVSGEGA